MANLLMTKFFKSIEIILKIYYYSTIKNRKDIFMKNRLMKNLFKVAALLIFFIFMFIQACGPTPAAAITDANQTPITTGVFSGDEQILEKILSIDSFNANSIIISLNGNQATLTNVSGESGNYTYGNGEMTLSLTIADSSYITVNITRLKPPYLLLENLTCSRQP